MDPEEVEEREFLVTLRGYSRDEVDAFKAEVAGHLRSLKNELDKSVETINDLKARLEEALSRPQPEPDARPVEESASKSEASPDRELAFKQVAQETERILMAAEQVAEQMQARARQESAEILTDARRQAQHGFDQVEEAKRRAERDIDSIRESRGLIASQMEDIRRRLDETINRLRIPVESPVTAVRPRGYREDRHRPAPGSEKPVAGPPPPPDVAQTAALRERERRLQQIAQRQAQEVTELQGREVAEASPTSELPEPDAPAAEPEAATEPEAPTEPEPATEREAPTEPEPSAAETKQESPASLKDGQGEEVVSSKGALDDLLEEFRRKRAEQPKSAAAAHEAEPPIGPAPAQAAGPVQADTTEEAERHPIVAAELGQRAEALSDLPNQAARRLKRLLQEEHNDILDRLRTKKTKGGADQIVASTDEQMVRFQEGLGKVLGEAFQQGHRSAGGAGTGDAAAVERLIARQIVKPLRAEVTAAIQAGLDADDAASSVAERASDVFRVWKGVRTELLGEGMAHAAYHQGLLDHWSGEAGTKKVWIVSEEDECPGDVCIKNAEAGPIGLKASFPSGHILPPAHGGCLCTLTKARKTENH